MKKQLLLLVMMLLPMMAMADKSGTCGENLTWTLEESTGKLTISGTGWMNDYQNSSSTCAPWYGDRERILSVVIENGVTSVGYYAFYNCTRLKSVEIPGSVVYLGSSAFRNCTDLTTITICDGVRYINSGTFANCTGLTSIDIPNSVEYITARAFDGCTGLTQPVFNSTCFAFMPRSFQGEYEIPDGIIKICEWVFSNCTGLTSVNIPNSVTEIGEGAFAGCGITSVTIPNSVIYINNGAFQECSSMTSIRIGSSVTNINNAFYGCSNLQKVIVSDIAAWCRIEFRGGIYANPLYYAHHLFSDENIEITDLIIPEGVTSIGANAFYNCTSFTSITSYNSSPPICPSSSSNDAFTNVDHTIPVYVPIGSALKYKAADGWRNFVVFREISDEAEDVVLSISDGGNGVTQLLVDEAKPYFTLIFKADEGWKLHSVTLKGENVTYEVGEDGKYTTPPITASSSINVVYEQSSSQGINAVNGTPLQVRGGNGEVIISRISSEITDVTVYQIDGKQILQQPLSDIETHISLPEGHVYIIKAGNLQYKVGL